MLPEQFASMVADAKARIDARAAVYRQIIADTKMQAIKDEHDEFDSAEARAERREAADEAADRRSEWRGAL